ncbi:hypothetical protein [Deinococcus arboris]|uniref:hypothetical protein n=1 Tax=Deinococcus arboris TaxID=2682977 RepID=UPI0018DD07E1|nr:hypothetical protein [Deinococcus arboris]
MPPTAALPVNTEQTPRWWPWARALFLLPLLLLPLLVVPVLLFAPQALRLPVYTVQGGQITARSLASRTSIPAGTPVQRRPVTLRGKLIGSDLPGYTVGTFWVDQSRAAVYSDGSQGKGALVFATQPPTVLTPADPDALLRVWRSGGSGDFRPARPAQLSWPELLVLLPLVPLLAFFLSKPRVRYAQDGDALVVRTWASSTRFPRTGTTATLTAAPLGLRLFGTAIPGYYSGTFSSAGASGGHVQAAAGSSRPAQALLLTHRGRTFYLTPQDPAALAAWFEGPA